MKSLSHPELSKALEVIERLADKGNLLAKSLLRPHEYYKQHHIADLHNEFKIVFYFDPNDSASWGSHSISFSKDYHDLKFKFVYEQYQMKVSEDKVESYQSFMNELFDILKSLKDDYRGRNPVEENFDSDY